MRTGQRLLQTEIADGINWLNNRFMNIIQPAKKNAHVSSYSFYILFVCV